MMKTTISIFRDGEWAGDGEITADGEITGCAAVLGASQGESDETYMQIMDAIDLEPQDAGRYTGEGSLTRPDGEYTWVIREDAR